MEMARATGTKTPYPGVWSLGGRRYRLRIYVTNPKTGRPREVDRIVEADGAAQAARMRSALTDKAEAAKAAPQRKRFAEYATSWLKARRPRLRPSTLARYGNSLAVHLVPAFGEIWLDALSSEDISAWRDRQTLEASTTNGHLRVLRTMLTAAEDELGIRSAARHVALLPEDREEDEHHVLTAAELGRLLEQVPIVAPSWNAFLLVMATTGMRFSEVSALRWSDIDIDAGVITIRRSQWSGHEGPTKTRKTRRVPLLPELAAMLKEQRREQIAEQVPGLERGIVFPSRVGGFRSRHSISKPLRKAAKAAGLEREPTGHWLRHTLSDLLRKAATGQVQKAITGHSTDRSAEHYSHVGIDERRDAVVLALAPLTGDSTGDHGDGKRKAL